MANIFIRVKSHRARQRMERELGREPQGYFSFDFDGEFREVTEEEWARLQDIKGLSRARVDKEKLRQYWPTML